MRKVRVLEAVDFSQETHPQPLIPPAYGNEQDLQPVRDFHAALGLDKSPSLCSLELVTCYETGYTLTVRGFMIIF